MNDLFGGAFKGKKVLVTGHTGFKGGWLSLWLSRLGANVIGYALSPDQVPSLFKACHIADHVENNFGDIRDLDGLWCVFEKFQPDVVFHLAAQPLVRFSYQQPLETFSTNVLGTANILECIRKSESVQCAVIVTSDKCYENKEWDYSYRENDPIGGTDPYSASKGAAEIVTTSYRRSFFSSENSAQIVTARAGNVIGGGDWSEDRLIPDCVRAQVQGQHILLRHPESVRPWQYVLEPLAGYLMLASELLQGRPIESAWNFGPDCEDAIPVSHIVDKFLECWGSGQWRYESHGQKNSLHEAKTLRLDCSLARGMLGWKPLYGVNEAILETTRWYKNYYQDDKSSQVDFSFRQIQKYVDQGRERLAKWTLSI